MLPVAHELRLVEDGAVGTEEVELDEDAVTGV